MCLPRPHEGTHVFAFRLEVHVLHLPENRISSVSSVGRSVALPTTSKLWAPEPSAARTTLPRPQDSAQAHEVPIQDLVPRRCYRLGWVKAGAVQLTASGSDSGLERSPVHCCHQLSSCELYRAFLKLRLRPYVNSSEPSPRRSYAVRGLIPACCHHRHPFLRLPRSRLRPSFHNTPFPHPQARQLHRCGLHFRTRCNGQSHDHSASVIAGALTRGGPLRPRRQGATMSIRP